MEQRSKEWYDARKGKLTGSNIGAALGINPYKTPEDLIRQMVRDYHGAESEFKGNIATEYGQRNEALAMVEYLGVSGNLPQDCGFFVHPEYEWLGASPDGLIDEDGVLEIKCPFGKRNDRTLGFISLEEQQHYYAQVQIEMACTGRQWCDFFQWNKHGYKIETVNFSQKWFDDNLPALESFYKWYLSELDNPVYLEPKKVEIEGADAERLTYDYTEACRIADQATARKKELLAELVELSKGRDAIICGRKLTKVTRKGTVGYAKVVKEHLPDIDLEPYTGKETSYWKLS